MTLTRKQFISKIAADAVADSIRTKVAASVTIAQGCLESADGNSMLSAKYNNLFGIKGKGPAGSVSLPTKEQTKDGKEYTVMAPFRVYNNWAESIYDHSLLLINGVSWNKDLYRKAVGVMGKEAALQLQLAGYATDKKYAEKLINIMDTYNLHIYDMHGEAFDMTEDMVKNLEELLKIAKSVNMTDWLRETSSERMQLGKNFVVDNGISDGNRAGAPLTREEAWMMFKRYHEKSRGS